MGEWVGGILSIGEPDHGSGIVVRWRNAKESFGLFHICGKAQNSLYVIKDLDF